MGRERSIELIPNKELGLRSLSFSLFVMSKLILYQLNSLNVDPYNFKNRFPKSFVEYTKAWELIVDRNRESLIGASYIDDSEMAGWMCVNHFYPGSRKDVMDYLTLRDFPKASIRAIPKLKNTEFGGVEVDRFMDYEAYYFAMEKVKSDIRNHDLGVSEIEILWTTDGNIDIVDAINSTIFPDTPININFYG